MSGIFGIIYRDDKPVTLAKILSMHDAMAYWGPDGNKVWREGCAGLGQCLLYNTPEAQYEHLPRWLPERKIAFTAEARIDNRDVLCRSSIFPLKKTHDIRRRPDSTGLSEMG